MRQLIRNVIASVGITSVMACAMAIPCQPGPGAECQGNTTATTILFINGINNSQTQVELSAKKLIESLKADGLPPSTYNLEHFFNPTDGFFNDTAEVRRQAAISNLYLATGNYYKSLGDYYNARYAIVDGLSGVEQRIVSVAGQLKQNIKDILATSAGIVIVPHSQGNLYVEAAYAMLQADGNTALLSRIRVVGVAVAAATTPSGRYITHDSDRVIWFGPLSERVATSLLNDFIPKAPNETACIAFFCGESISWTGFIDKTAHGFQEVYLNQSLTSQASGVAFPKIIFGLISASLSEIDAAKTPYAVFDNFGNRNFCSVDVAVNCPGSAFIGVGFFNLQLGKLALAVAIPAGPAVDLTSIEVPVYYSAGSNQITISVRQDAGGLPYPFAVVTSQTLAGSMKSIFSFFADPTPTTLLVGFSPGSVVLQGGSRYWIEVSAPALNTSAIWTFGPIPMFGNLAQSFNGHPYALTGDQEPALRVVVTPH